MSAHRILQNVSKVSPFLMNRTTATGVTRLAWRQPSAFISTSKKQSDTTVVTDPTIVTGPKTVEDFANPSKQNYQSYGFDDDPDKDINARNQMMFVSVTIALVGGAFVMMYFPDQKMRDWTKREAYIELARREALGLPAVDPNLVPPENVHLPTEEELGDFELII